MASLRSPRLGLLLFAGVSLASPGCSGDDKDVGSTPDDTAAPDDTAHADDTDAADDTGDAGDDTGDTGEDPAPSWTTGPELPECTPSSGDGDLVALSGVVLTPDGAEAGLLVYSRSDGLILCAGEDCDATGADVLCTEGVISPGLINAHDHMQYNILAPWQHEGLFSDRYDWRSDGDYWDYRTAYDEVMDAGELDCEVMKWAELRQLVGGTTSAVGSYGGDCMHVLIRNLDEDEYISGLDDYDVVYSAATVTDRYDDGDGEYYAAELASGDIDAVLNHVGEGVGGSVHDEIDWMLQIGMSGPGQVYVHTTDASVDQLATMSMTGTSILWSPRSNLDLYAGTTPADVAMRLGVPVAIGTDWTWSGSHNITEELVCAMDWLGSRDADVSDVHLWRMVTSLAAEATGSDDQIGALEPGLRADVAVFSWSDEPYRAIIEAGPEDVRLVLVNGEALYGTDDLALPLAAASEWCEAVEPCGGEARSLCVQAAETGDDAETAALIEGLLSSALEAVSMPEDLAYAGELLGLWACEDPRPSCDISAPTDGDADGDGIADGDDLCADAYDPDQGDFDRDGVGDVCDPCPLNPVSDSCRHDSDDIDGDGVRAEDDNCALIYNPDLSDADDDGIGDACDLCPDYASADGACPLTIPDLRDPTSASHPDEGAAVLLSDVIVTAVADGSGFYVQDTDATEYGGLYVYDRGANDVEPGQIVSIAGTYVEYYGLTELSDVTVEVTGLATIPTPITVAACDIGTGASLAETYEAMLVTVASVTVSDENPDGSSDYGEFEVEGCLRVDDLVWVGDSDAWEALRVEDLALDSLTGVLNYSFSNHKLSPRDEDDVVR